MQKTVNGLTYYDYEPMDPTLLPPIYVAYHATLSEPTEVFHNDIRGRYNRGDPQIVKAMEDFAQLAQDGRQAILERDAARLSQLIDENFDLRNSISTLAPWQIQMIQSRPVMRRFRQIRRFWRRDCWRLPGSGHVPGADQSARGYRLAGYQTSDSD